MRYTNDFRSSHYKPGRYKTLLYRLTVSILIFVVFYLLANNVYASGDYSDTKPDFNSVTRGTTWLLPSNGKYIEALQLQSTVNIDVSGMIARTHVQQKFSNTSSLWAEGIYVFPLPENAAVDHFKLIIAGKVIEGKIQEKQQAKKTYETAKRNGLRSGLMEQNRPNIFTTRLANIAPGAEMMVEIEYQQTLQYRDGQYSLRYPLVVGERYITASRQAAMNPEYNRGIITESSSTSNNLNQTAISINLDTGISVSNIVSSSHQISINPLPDNHYLIALKNTQVPADRDFLLKWTPELSKLPKATVFNQKHDGYEYSLVTVYPPKNDLYNQLDIPRELVFILDISGSMSGTSIEQAKSALKLSLDRLRPSDKFNIIWFNDMAKKVFFNSMFASNINIEHAKRFINTLSAGGGTEMLPALQLAFATAAEPEFLRQIVFITDGNVSNERDLFSYIKNSLGNNRLFTVGIGSAPNSFFMSKAAKAGRGSFTFISNTREVGEKIEALSKKLETPALTDIKLSIYGDEVESYHNPVPDLYIGEPVSVLLRGKNLINTILINGKIGTNPWQYEVLLNSGSDNKGVKTAWAREKIAALSQDYHEQKQGNLKDHLKLQIIEESIKHHLLSQFTSLVAVDTTPVNQSGSLHSERIINNLPHGWTRSTSRRANAASNKIYLPQTATGMYRHFVIAILCFALAFMLRRKICE